MTSYEVADNKSKKRFEIHDADQVAYLEYMPAGENIVISHTEVPVELEGKGIGSFLVKHTLETLKANHQKAIITCPFAIAYIQRHPEYLDVVFGYPKK